MNTNILNQPTGYQVTPSYKVIPTQSVIDRLVYKGYKVEKIVQTKPRKADKAGFQKHMIRLSHPSLGAFHDSRLELVIVNSYDGSTALKVMLGVYRIVCSNGLIVGSTVDQVSIRHVGDVWTQLDHGLAALHDKVGALNDAIERMSRVGSFTITPLIEEAARLILPASAISYDTHTLTKPRRQEDLKNDLWTIFNRVQEACICGGVRYQYEKQDASGQRSGGQRITRAIKSIDRQVEINRALWTVAERLAA